MWARLENSLGGWKTRASCRTEVMAVGLLSSLIKRKWISAAILLPDDSASTLKPALSEEFRRMPRSFCRQNRAWFAIPGWGEPPSSPDLTTTEIRLDGA